MSGRFVFSTGFGTGALMGAGDSGVRQTLLETAFDAGIRHFDTARYYGLGYAEEEVGKFVARHRGSITITTKSGLMPPSVPVAAIERIVSRLAKHAPTRVDKALIGWLLKQKARRSNRFSPAETREAVDSSLRRLKVDRIDYYLLHDIQGPDSITDELASVLQSAQDSGKVGAYGVSGGVEAIKLVLAKFPALRVIQHEYSVAYPLECQAKGLATFVYRPLHDEFRSWSAAIEADAQRRSTLESALNLPLDTSVNRTGAWLRFALGPCSGQTVLFSSRSPANIQTNAANLALGQLSPEQRQALREDYKATKTR